MTARRAINCARCIVTSPASRTERFSVGDDSYELDLCDKHAQQFDREIGGWTRIARDATPITRQTKLTITREREMEQLTRPLERAFTAPVAKAPPADGSVVVTKLPPKYHLWSLTAHAHQRCGERNITQREALLCASDPALAYPHDVDPDKWIHVRGEVLTIVNPANYEVITVMPRDYLQMGEREVASISSRG